MTIDLSVLESCGKSVVRCMTKEFAKMFVDAMWEQYPNKMKPAWNRDETNWSIYANDPDGICYKHRIAPTGEHIDFCQSTNYRSAVRDGCTIIEIEELICRSADFGEFERSDSVCDFFGL